MTRIIAVGDTNQGIYKFRGADSKAIDNIKDMLCSFGKVECLKLPINYRSDKQIISFSKELVADLEGFSQAEGTVDTISFYDALNRANNEKTDIELPDGIDFADRSLEDCKFAFLCRTNLPLIITAYELIKDNIRVKILGKETIADPMIKLITNLCSIENDSTEFISDIESEDEIIDGLLTRLDRYYNIQSKKLSDESSKNKLEELKQKCDCIKVVVEKVQSDQVKDLIEEIEFLFNDDSDDSRIILSSGHKSKGLEFNVVFVLRPDLMPHPNAKENEDGSFSEDQQQEKNIEYVIRTRAENRLYYIGDWPFENKSGLADAVCNFKSKSDENLIYKDFDDESENFDQNDNMKQSFKNQAILETEFFDDGEPF